MAEADIEIPGQVRRCGGEYDFAILPYAQVVGRGEDGTRAALLAAEVRDERGLHRAMVALRGAGETSPFEDSRSACEHEPRSTTCWA